MTRLETYVELKKASFKLYVLLRESEEITEEERSDLQLVYHELSDAAIKIIQGR